MTAIHDTMTTVATCPRCSGTGCTGPGRPCSCDARPFICDESAAVAIKVAHRPDPAPVRVPTDLEVVVDRAQVWASRHLVHLIRLAHWTPYLTDGGPQSVAAGRVAVAALDVARGFDELPQLVADLHRVARAVSEVTS